MVTLSTSSIAARTRPQPPTRSTRSSRASRPFGAYVLIGVPVLLGLVFLWQFAYLTVAIRRFYLAKGQWGGWLLSVAAALLLYVLNSAFMTAVQVAGAAIALALI